NIGLKRFSGRWVPVRNCRVAPQSPAHSSAQAVSCRRAAWAPYILPMPRPTKDTTPKPRASRGKSGKLPAPPVEGLSGTPETKRSAAAGFAEAPQAPFLPAAPSTLPALRQVGPPSRNFADMTASLNALLAKPDERSERARQVLAQQPMLAAHPLVSGGMPMFMPHRPPRPEKSEGGIRFDLSAEYEPRGDQPQAIAEL